MVARGGGAMTDTGHIIYINIYIYLYLYIYIYIYIYLCIFKLSVKNVISQCCAVIFVGKFNLEVSYITHLCLFCIFN